MKKPQTFVSPPERYDFFSPEYDVPAESNDLYYFELKRPPSQEKIKKTPVKALQKGVSNPELDEQMYLAAESNDLTKVKQRLADGVLPNATFEKAILEQNAKVIQVLIDAGVDVNLPVAERGILYTSLTPLELWVLTYSYRKNLAICEHLLNAGAQTKRALTLVSSFILPPSFDGNDYVKLNQLRLKNLMVKLNLIQITIPSSKVLMGQCFHEAIGTDSLHIAEVYLKNGLDPDTIDPDSRRGQLRYLSQVDLKGKL